MHVQSESQKAYILLKEQQQSQGQKVPYFTAICTLAANRVEWLEWLQNLVCGLLDDLVGLS